jgi:hypothetical protein
MLQYIIFDVAAHKKFSMLQYLFFDVALHVFFDIVVRVFAMLQHIIFDVAVHVFRYCTTYFCDVAVFKF